MNHDVKPFACSYTQFEKLLAVYSGPLNYMLEAYPRWALLQMGKHHIHREVFPYDEYADTQRLCEIHSDWVEAGKPLWNEPLTMKELYQNGVDEHVVLSLSLLMSRYHFGGSSGPARMWATECAARKLLMFESHFPNEQRPRQALREARFWNADGHDNKYRWRTRLDKLRGELEELRWQLNQGPRQNEISSLYLRAAIIGFLDMVIKTVDWDATDLIYGIGSSAKAFDMLVDATGNVRPHLLSGQERVARGIATNQRPSLGKTERPRDCDAAPEQKWLVERLIWWLYDRPNLITLDPMEPLPLP